MYLTAPLARPVRPMTSSFIPLFRIRAARAGALAGGLRIDLLHVALKDTH